MSNMRQKYRQRTLKRWINPDKVFLKREVINQLKEHDFYEKNKFE